MWKYLLLLIGLLSAELAFSQGESLYNPNSVRPIRKDEMMFKKGLWFRLDLRTKQNVGLFAANNELPRILIEAVREGKIQPFRSDSLTTRMTPEEFLANIRLPQTDQEDMLDDNDSGTWDRLGIGNSNTATTSAPAEYLPNQLYIIEIREDYVFDKRRGRMYHDLQAITLILPARFTKTGIERVIASFSYKELYEQVFHIRNTEGKLVDNPRAIWYNMQNPAAHLNLADAFDLRLFESRLVKYENPKNNAIVDMYSGKKALIESQEVIMKLIEYEATLWSY